MAPSRPAAPCTRIRTADRSKPNPVRLHHCRLPALYPHYTRTIPASNLYPEFQIFPHPCAQQTCHDPSSLNIIYHTHFRLLWLSAAGQITPISHTHRPHTSCRSRTVVAPRTCNKSWLSTVTLAVGRHRSWAAILSFTSIPHHIYSHRRRSIQIDISSLPLLVVSPYHIHSHPLTLARTAHSRRLTESSCRPAAWLPRSCLRSCLRFGGTSITRRRPRHQCRPRWHQLLCHRLH